MKGEFLKKKVEDADVVSAELARALDISPQTLNQRYKSNSVTLGFVIDVAKAIQKPLNYFLDDLPEAKGIYLRHTEKIDVSAEPTVEYGKNSLNLISLIANELLEKLSPKFKKMEEQIKELDDRIDLNEEIEKLKDKLHKGKVIEDN